MIELRKHLSGFRKMNNAVAQLERDPGFPTLSLPAPIIMTDKPKRGNQRVGGADSRPGNQPASLSLTNDVRSTSVQQIPALTHRQSSNNYQNTRQTESFTQLGKRGHPS